MSNEWLRHRGCSRKVRYRDLQTAEFVAYRCVCVRTTGPVLRAYACQFCRGFHLTSKRPR